MSKQINGKSNGKAKRGGRRWSSKETTVGFSGLSKGKSRMRWKEYLKKKHHIQEMGGNIPTGPKKKKKRTGLLAGGPRSSFLIKTKCVLFGNQGPRVWRQNPS